MINLASDNKKIPDRPTGNSPLLLPHVPHHPGRRRGDPAWLTEEDHAGQQWVVASHLMEDNNANDYISL